MAVRSATRPGPGPRQAATSTLPQPEQGIYVYGILPADVELAAEMPGVGEPPGRVRLVRCGALAALVSEVNVSGRLGSPDDLRAHMEILDAAAAEVPVLPLRFGAVLPGEDAVIGELLEANHDEFADALRGLEGHAEYVVKGRYVEPAILAEVLAENPQAARLRDEICGLDEIATRDARIQLGEIINEAVTVKRAEDTRVLGEAMAGHCAASVVREPTHELDAMHAAFLVGAGQESGMQQMIAVLAGEWDRRVELRLLGPMAAYDFAGTIRPAG